MARTQLTSREIGSIQRNDLDIITAGQAIVARLIAGTGITFSSTGVDTGTGDVTINSTGGGSGSGITRSILNISSNQTGGATASTDYVYLCTGSFTYTQPTAVSNTNRYSFKNIGTGELTILLTGGQTLDGYTSVTLTATQSIDIISNGTNWFIIG